MFNIVLFEPEIPPNTGNIIRLCANTGCHLHLIHPLAFNLSDKQLQRAGLDYHDLTRVSEYKDFQEFIDKKQPGTVWAIETCGQSYYHEVEFKPGDYLLFGSETKGLTPSILEKIEAQCILKLPMLPNNRSLNLSNCAAIVTYEAWRQNGFK